MNTKLEKVARMGGKTTYKDFREGFAACSLMGDSDADIKAALGMAQRRAGGLAVQVLETRYASTLMHERALRRAWDRVRKDAARTSGKTRDKCTVTTDRLGAALAIRYVAGAKISKPDVEEWSWLLCVSHGTLAAAIHQCTSWLDELCSDAERAFIDAMGARKRAA